MMRVLTLLILATGANLVTGAVKPDEHVVLYPTAGWLKGSNWELEIHGCVYETERRPLITAAFGRALGVNESRLTPEEAAIWHERSRFFLADNERRKRISVRIGGQTFTAGKSKANGHFAGRFRLPAAGPVAVGASTNRVLQVGIVDGSPRPNHPPGEVHLLAETGVSVISDIDDTIKFSQVLDRKQLLLNTFARPFKPVPGMAELYERWQRQGAQFHYVSASPWQLYVPLSSFLHSNAFPSGTFHLKQFRLKDETFLDLFDSPEQFKTAVIRPILDRFPQRRFVLVGDSGEKDPEIYAELARRCPEQVSRILIRDVTGEDAKAPRYARVFNGLPRDLWTVFSTPSEIQGLPGWPAANP